MALGLYFAAEGGNVPEKMTNCKGSWQNISVWFWAIFWQHPELAWQDYSLQ